MNTKRQIIRVLPLIVGLLFLAPPLVAPAQTTTNKFDWNTVVTNIAIAPYFTYAPHAQNGASKVGGGVLGLYNLNQNIAAGIGVDWLGQFTMVSGNIQFKVPTHPLAYFGAPNFTVTPLVGAALGTPFSGNGNENNNITTMQIAGADIRLPWQVLTGNIGVGGAWVNVTGTKDYNGGTFRGFFAWSKGF